MHIALCDDEEYIRFYLKSLIEREEGDFRITEFSSGKELLRYAEDKGGSDIDILFLDIAMSDTDGMEAAKVLRQRQMTRGETVWGSLPLIIFVTGYSDYMSQAFGVNAFGFIVKPIDEAEFGKLLKRAVNECRQILSSYRRPDIFEVKTGSSRQMIPVEKILFIESIGHKARFHLKDGVVEFGANIGDIEAELSPRFFRVHKGYLVNLGSVVRFDRSEVYLKSGDRIPISKYRYKDFTEAYMNMISGEYAAVRRCRDES